MGWNTNKPLSVAKSYVGHITRAWFLLPHSQPYTYSHMSAMSHRLDSCRHSANLTVTCHTDLIPADTQPTLQSHVGNVTQTWFLQTLSQPYSHMSAMSHRLDSCSHTANLTLTATCQINVDRYDFIHPWNGKTKMRLGRNIWGVWIARDTSCQSSLENITHLHTWTRQQTIDFNTCIPVCYSCVWEVWITGFEHCQHV